MCLRPAEVKISAQRKRRPRRDQPGFRLVTKKEILMQIVKSVVGGSAAILLLSALPASAQDRTRQLRGDYAFTGTAVCTSSPAGFSPSFVPLGSSSESSFGTTGVVAFNGDGTGTLSGRTITQPGAVQGLQPGTVEALDTSIPITYSVAADRTLTVIQGPSLNTFVAGTLAGQQNSSSGVPPFVGHLSLDRKSFVFGTFDPAVETITFLTSPTVTQRICFRSFTGIRIGKSADSPDDDN
jgi:hypothetical protein